MDMTSNCDVTNNAHQIQMTTICHWMKPPPWKLSAYATVQFYQQCEMGDRFCCTLLRVDCANKHRWKWCAQQSIFLLGTNLWHGMLTSAEFF